MILEIWESMISSEMTMTQCFKDEVGDLEEFNEEGYQRVIVRFDKESGRFERWVFDTREWEDIEAKGFLE